MLGAARRVRGGGREITCWFLGERFLASASTLAFALLDWSLAKPNPRTAGVIRWNENHSGAFECRLHAHEGADPSRPIRSQIAHSIRGAIPTRLVNSPADSHERSWFPPANHQQLIARRSLYCDRLRLGSSGGLSRSRTPGPPA